jgi:hypothetical protein
MPLPYNQGGVLPSPDGSTGLTYVRLSVGERIISSTGDVTEVTGISVGSDGTRYTTRHVGTIDMSAVLNAVGDAQDRATTATTHVPHPPC